MIKDKNQEKREQLYKQIIQLENQEEDLLVIKKRYEEKVMDFRADIWTINAQIENLIDPVYQRQVMPIVKYGKKTKPCNK